MDKWIEDELIPQYTKGQKRNRSSAYRSLIMKRCRAKKNGQWQQYSQLGKSLRQIPSKDPYDLDYRRLRYVRFADDFLLGHIGTKAEAEQIKQQISDFLNGISLTLSPEKTLITHARSQTAHFLGYDIQVSWNNSRLKRSSTGQKSRSVNGVIRLDVPHSVVTKWMQKYCESGKPFHHKRIVHYSDYEIVATFGAQIRGLVNYYQLAPNISRLEQVYWACLESCRKTLVAKYKLRKKQSYKRYYVKEAGKRKHIQVVIERPDRKPLIARCGEKPLKYRSNATYANDKIPSFTVVGRQRELTKRLLAQKCECCNTEGVPLQAHHINKLANLKRRWQGRKQKPAWVEWMISRNRKTIFVCRPCHQDITYGRYDGAKPC